MKKLKFFTLTVLFSLGTITSFGQNKNINVEKSSIDWVGKKVTGQHNGSINFQKGVLVFKNDKLAGGNFIVDMSSITVLDLTGEWKGKLEGHLNSDDFFGTEKFKTSNLVFKKIKDKGNGLYTITADLTIKDITNSIVFDIKVNETNANATFVVDRTKFNIKYGSSSFFDSLGDKAIYDNFELKVNIKY